MAARVEPSYSEALAEARRGFDLLSGEVEAIRGRAVAVLSGGGVAAAFIGGLTIRDGAVVSCWTWTAVGAFVGLAVLAVLVRLPRRLHVSQDPAAIVGWAEDHSASSGQIERELALWLGRKYDENRPKVNQLGTTCAVAACAFLIEIAALVMDLMTR